MPQSVHAAAPRDVMPYSLASAFTEIRALPVPLSTYKDGRSQRTALATASRVRFQLSKRLPTAELAPLRAFYLAHIGLPFYFYPLRADFDPTGSSAAGRYTVRFEGGWAETLEIGRQPVSLELIEVA